MTAVSRETNALQCAAFVSVWWFEMECSEVERIDSLRCVSKLRPIHVFGEELAITRAVLRPVREVPARPTQKERASKHDCKRTRMRARTRVRVHVHVCPRVCACLCACVSVVRAQQGLFTSRSGPSAHTGYSSRCIAHGIACFREELAVLVGEEWR